jgi:hypothetical protein
MTIGQMRREMEGLSDDNDVVLILDDDVISKQVQAVDLHVHRGEDVLVVKLVRAGDGDPEGGARGQVGPEEPRQAGAGG